ncbi:hypothetical protein H8356DRAFT_1332075 [Neocallimastix lanati (nom. inval.)]|nr:hypothetical protein H8356DRAFT_1332075 [Neocallimastix sp. JGI-2020a]
MALDIIRYLSDNNKLYIYNNYLLNIELTENIKYDNNNKSLILDNTLFVEISESMIKLHQNTLSFTKNVETGKLLIDYAKENNIMLEKSVNKLDMVIYIVNQLINDANDAKENNISQLASKEECSFKNKYLSLFELCSITKYTNYSGINVSLPLIITAIETNNIEMVKLLMDYIK